ncbi:MAG: hypothetical protein WC022_01225 [Parcubacteria group bacterium]
MFKKIFYYLLIAIAILSCIAGISAFIFFDIIGEIAMDNFSLVANSIAGGFILISATSAACAIKIRNFITVEELQKNFQESNVSCLQA